MKIYKGYFMSYKNILTKIDNKVLSNKTYVYVPNQICSIQFNQSVTFSYHTAKKCNLRYTYVSTPNTKPGSFKIIIQK